MPLTLTSVTGPIYLPNGATPVGGRVSFELSSWDQEEGEALFITGPVYSTIDVNGQFLVNLHTTTSGNNSVHYRMFVIWEDSELTQSYVNEIYVSSPTPHYTKKYIGSFALSGPGPFHISDLNIISETNNSSFDAYLEMKAFADRIDLGAIDDAVAATAEDRIQTGIHVVASAASAAASAAAADDATAVLADMVALSGGKQRTIVSSPYVVLADDWKFEVTNYSANVVEIDARALEYGRTYRFRCFALSANSMKIDLGPNVTISGYQGFTGVELLFGQACQIVKSVDGIAYVTGEFASVYRTMVTADAWYQRDQAGEYTYFRRNTAAAGASTLTLPSTFKQKALANRVHIVGLATNDAAATGAIVARGFTDDATSLRLAIYNPNAATTTYEITIGGLRTSTSALANTANHFRQDVPPLEDAVKLTRNYTIVTAGQSLADAYTNRSCYAGLDATLRTAGTLVNGTAGVGGTFLDVVNTAVGGTYADLQSRPAGSTTGYWYDSATNTNGPLLTTALADIATAIGAGKTIQKIIFDLGQAESIRLGNGGATKANVKEAFEAILAALAAACPGTTELYLQLIVGREEAADTGTRIMREIQLELLAGNPNVDGAIDHYDSELIDSVHPTDAAYYVVGQRMGRLFVGTYAPPVVSSAVKSGAAINVTLTGGIDLTRTPPGTVLDYIGIRTTGGVYYPVTATVAGGTSLTLTAKAGSGLTTLADADQMLLPFDNSALVATVFAANAAGDLIRSAQVTVT